MSETDSTSSALARCLRPILSLSGVLLLSVAVYIFIWPLGIIVTRLMDPALRTGHTPAWVVDHFKRLAPRYTAWAKMRVDSGSAAELSTHDISGTEWPLFGTVFFLWATEELHAKKLVDTQTPEIREAIDASLTLVLDPHHAQWVKDHWGPNYMHTENAFYRLLRISAMVSHYKTTGDGAYLDMLRKETLSLMAEIDDSPTGLIDDYPGQCYPCDIVAAVAAINRSCAILGIDCQEFLKRARRAFTGKALDKRGMIPYFAEAARETAIGPTRGCSNSYISLSAPDAFPDLARQWYSDYETHFWQSKWGAQGFREFPKDIPGREWYFDVDAGPVVAGHGFAASAFGIGAARVNGRLDHAFPLSCELIVFSWPLPHGTLYLPRLLSNAADAPYLGEASIIYSLTRAPHDSVSLRKGGSIPAIVYIMLLAYVIPGGLLGYIGIKRIKQGLRDSVINFPYLRIQLALWMALIGLALVSVLNSPALAVVLIALAGCMPLSMKRPPEKVHVH